MVPPEEIPAPAPAPALTLMNAERKLVEKETWVSWRLCSRIRLLAQIFGVYLRY